MPTSCRFFSNSEVASSENAFLASSDARVARQRRGDRTGHAWRALLLVAPPADVPGLVVALCTIDRFFNLLDRLRCSRWLRCGCRLRPNYYRLGLNHRLRLNRRGRLGDQLFRTAFFIRGLGRFAHKLGSFFCPWQHGGRLHDFRDLHEQTLRTLVGKNLIGLHPSAAQGGDSAQHVGFVVGRKRKRRGPGLVSGGAESTKA
ncbi:Uncharacterised protein [Trueperella pyogenes]|nr:Uncharacterised protein [Trueperella pyogenes]